MRKLLFISIFCVWLQIVCPDPFVVTEYDEDLVRFYFTGGCALVYGFVYYENGTSRYIDQHDRKLLANYSTEYNQYRNASSSSNVEMPSPQVPCLCDAATCADTKWCSNFTESFISGGCALQGNHVYDNGTMRAVTDNDREKMSNYNKAFDEYMSTKFNESYKGPELESPKIPCFCESAICAEDMN